MADFRERFNAYYADFRDGDYSIGRKALAKHLRSSTGQVSGWLDGTGRPDYEKLVELGEIMGVSILWLIGASDDKNYPAPSGLDATTIVQKEYDFLMAFLKFRHGDLVDKVEK